MFVIEPLIITFIYLIDIILLVPKYTRCKYDHTSRTKKLIWKGACIGLPFVVLLAETVKNLILSESTLIGWGLVLGMALCGVGDILLEVKFVRGGFFFFFGHVVYVITLYLMNEKITVLSVILYGFLAYVGSFLTIKKLSKKYRHYLLFYNFAISGSCALAIPLILTGKPAMVMVGTGACLLVASDWLLARNKTYGSTYNWSLASLLLYFGGQILISTYPFLK